MHHTNHDKITGTWVAKVLGFIQINLFEDLSLQRLADVAHYSPYHFQRIFAEYVGESPKQYIIRLRLERIAHYLKVFPNLSISELADKSGFASLSTFSRAFKNYFGVSAEEYRRMSEDDYRKFCKMNRKICKGKPMNTPDLYLRDFSTDEIMDWKEKVNITTKRMAGFSVIYVSTCLDKSDSISLAFRKLCQWAVPRGLITDETRFIGMLLDIPFITPLEKCRYWAGITFPGSSKLPGEANITEIGGGLYANFQLTGNLLSTLKTLMYFNHSWLPENGYVMQDIRGYEVFSGNPADRPAETIEKEILVPVRPA
jgi:AraC family transcriptional regulator